MHAQAALRGRQTPHLRLPVRGLGTSPYADAFRLQTVRHPRAGGPRPAFCSRTPPATDQPAAALQLRRPGAGWTFLKHGKLQDRCRPDGPDAQPNIFPRRSDGAGQGAGGCFSQTCRGAAPCRLPPPPRWPVSRACLLGSKPPQPVGAAETEVFSLSPHPRLPLLLLLDQAVVLTGSACKRFPTAGSTRALGPVTAPPFAPCRSLAAVKF